jgi:hypothetical protein
MSLDISIRIRTDPIGPRQPGFIAVSAIIEVDGMEAEAWGQGPNYEEALRGIGRIVDRHLVETLSKRRVR